MHFIYTGLFHEDKEEVTWNHDDGDGPVREAKQRSKHANQGELIASMQAINAQFPVAGLEDILAGAVLPKKLPKREFMHGETFPPLADALSRLLHETESDSSRDITLRLTGTADGVTPTEYARAAHRFILAARSTAPSSSHSPLVEVEANSYLQPRRVLPRHASVR